MGIPTPRGPNAKRVLLCLFFFNVCFFLFSFANQNGKQRITIAGNETSLESVFKQIEKQSGMRFMYAIGLINTKEIVKVSFQQSTLDEVLSTLLTPRGIIWQYKDGAILLKQQGISTGDHRIQADAEGRGTINGKILDNKGEPIPGVTIMVKGTRTGTKSDVDGSFSLPNIMPGTILLITSIGFETKEITIKNLDVIIINLKTLIGVLDETVVIAYGSRKNREITGNVATIKAEEIAKSPVSNVLLAIQGRVPGISITQATGYSGGGVTTLIQGQNSIMEGNDPFFVIDGVPFTAQLLPNVNPVGGVSGVNGSNGGNPLNYINPNDIESITVLKDADATAIYGSKAANGAILITTKKGKIGKTKVSIDYQQGILGRPAKTNKMMNTSQYLEMRHEAKRNDGRSVLATDYDMNGFWDTTRTTDWQKVLVGNNAQYTNINTTVSGGAESVQYLIGGTFHRQTTVLPIKFADQNAAIHFSINTNSENKKFQMQVSGNYLVDNNRLPGIDLTGIALVLPPDAPALHNPDGTLNWMPNASGTSTFTNPLARINSRYSNKTNNLTGNLTVAYEIIPGLNVKSSFGYVDLNSKETSTAPLSAIAPENRQFTSRTGLYSINDLNSWIVEPQISYVKKIWKGKLDLLLGNSIQQQQGNGTILLGTGFNSDEAIESIPSAATLSTSASTEYTYKYNGYFGRINYNLNDKYIINISTRKDGSSRFGSKNRYHEFGAVGLAWIFSAENFISNNLSFLSFGKLRLSYGTAGNDQIGNYAYLSLYSPVIVGVPYRGINGLIPTGIPNPYLQWEETRKTNFGLDLGFLKDRFLLNVNYYINRSSNQLVGTGLPAIAGGYVLYRNNNATVQNSGWEFSADAKIIKGAKLNWIANANLTIPRNKLLKYDNIENSVDNGRLFVGKSLSVTQLFHYRGVNPETGVYQFEDSKGGLTPNPDYGTDRTVFLDLAQRFYGGLTNEFSYKSISLSFLIQFVKTIGKNNFTGNGTPGRINRNQPTYILDRWQKEGDQAAHQRYNSTNSLSGAIFNVSLSDGLYTDASYARVKNISLAWQLPEKWLKPAGISNARIYSNAQNLFTFTRYKGLDPETLSSSSLPPLKTLIVGAQLTF